MPTKPTTKKKPAAPLQALRCVFIEWEDAGALDDAGWVSRSAAAPPEPHMFKQVGFVVSYDDTAIVLTEAYNDDQMAQRTRIPRGMVRRLIDLDEYIK